MEGGERVLDKKNELFLAARCKGDTKMIVSNVHRIREDLKNIYMSVASAVIFLARERSAITSPSRAPALLLLHLTRCQHILQSARRRGAERP